MSEESGGTGSGSALGVSALDAKGPHFAIFVAGTNKRFVSSLAGESVLRRHAPSPTPLPPPPADPLPLRPIN
jgi:hypothetical protein